MNGKAYLEEVQRLDVLIRAARRKIARQKDAAASITPQADGERVQSSGSKQRMAEAVGSYVDTERDELLPLIRRREEILSNVKKVNGKLRFIVLYEHYFAGKSLRTVAREQHYSYSHIAREHSEGLAQIEQIIEKASERV